VHLQTRVSTWLDEVETWSEWKSDTRLSHVLRETVFVPLPPSTSLPSSLLPTSTTAEDSPHGVANRQTTPAP
jgi:hypothetical protein